MFEKPEGGTRRSVYGYIDRQDLPNLLRVFDYASPDQSAAKRTNTTVPQQSLFLLNSPFACRQARELAKSVDKQRMNDREFVHALYARLFPREAGNEELQITLRFLKLADQIENGLTPREQLAQLLLLTNEFCHVD
jgi:hypothetical protein